MYSQETLPESSINYDNEYICGARNRKKKLLDVNIP